jgi:hypothetical protein
MILLELVMFALGGVLAFLLTYPIAYRQGCKKGADVGIKGVMQRVLPMLLNAGYMWGEVARALKCDDPECEHCDKIGQPRGLN